MYQPVVGPASGEGKIYCVIVTSRKGSLIDQTALHEPCHLGGVRIAEFAASEQRQAAFRVYSLAIDRLLTQIIEAPTAMPGRRNLVDRNGHVVSVFRGEIGQWFIDKAIALARSS